MAEFFTGLFDKIPDVFWLLFFGFILMRIAWVLWVHYVRQSFIAGIDWVLLEIIPPREVLRSPKAMELFFTNALYHQSGKGLLELYWQGAVWFWFSLELVSIEGQVHFYIRIPNRIKGLVETQLYAQYPQAQVKVVDDYTLAVDEITPKSDWNLWGCEFGLASHDALPIQTYTAYGLDKDPKEEYKIDPLSPVIELFSGVIAKDEQMWVQIVIAPSKKTYKTPGTWRGRHDWLTEAQLEMERIMKIYTPGDPANTRAPGNVNADNQIKGIQEKILKIGFDCGIRVCYVAKKDAFKEDRRRDIRLIFRQYSKPYVNGFERGVSTQFDYPWHYTNRSLLKMKDRMLQQYRDREFFYPPLRSRFSLPFPFSIFFPKYWHHKIFILNTEELATIWHFPGQVIRVPTLERIESKESAPPTNLPT